jgi:hypothetical protein
MTTELQRAMARYEEARVQYRKAVLASLAGASNGDAIRQAIQSFQRANTDLERLAGRPPAPPAPRPEKRQRRAPEAFPVWGFMRRFLKAG